MSNVSMKVYFKGILVILPTFPIRIIIGPKSYH